MTAPSTDLIAKLPLLLAGPMLRRTEKSAVTVWVALKRACRVRLNILNTEDDGQTLSECCLTGERDTVAVGAHLHIVAVTAESPVGKVLLCDRIYAYDLCFIDQANNQTIALSEALKLPEKPACSLSYFAHQKPTFLLPPKQLKHLKLAHGSCRKPHGRGFDALPVLDVLVDRHASNLLQRPQQLFLTGDQIYGDDVANPLLWLATALGDALLGWHEELPIDSSQADKSSKKVRPQQLPAGRRAGVAEKKAGLTAGLDNKKARTTSHLFSFGEYVAVYLLAYSPACWVADIPNGHEVSNHHQVARQWNKDKHHMEQFLYALWRVRRLVANIATYTIFDDHDVSDDWNLNKLWCERTISRALGRTTLRNALLAYALFQGWGNTPAQFGKGQIGENLLSTVERWSRAEGTDDSANKQFVECLGLPKVDEQTQAPVFVQDGDVLILERAENALTWHYTIRSDCHEVIVLDTRTWRGYPSEDSPENAILPPQLLSPTAFRVQLEEPLQSHPEFSSSGTFIIAPTNVFGMRVLDWVQEWHLANQKVFAADVGDSWNLNKTALSELLTTLFKYRQNLVVLSGDIHYSSAIKATYHNVLSGQSATLWQFTSSAIKNEEFLTQILHTRLKEWLLPEQPRQWLGYLKRRSFLELPGQVPLLPIRELANRLSHLPPLQKPDWICQIGWLERKPAESVIESPIDQSLVPTSQRGNQKDTKFSWLKPWRSRWFQEGREVVGINNIAVVSFRVDRRGHRTAESDRAAFSDLPDSYTNEQPHLTIEQNHYWFSSWLPLRIVCSRFSEADDG